MLQWRKKEFWLIAVYVPNDCGDQKAFFWCINQFVISSKWEVLVGDWNTILDPNLDSRGASKVTNICFEV